MNGKPKEVDVNEAAENYHDMFVEYDNAIAARGHAAKALTVIETRLQHDRALLDSAVELLSERDAHVEHCEIELSGAMDALTEAVMGKEE